MYTFQNIAKRFRNVRNFENSWFKKKLQNYSTEEKQNLTGYFLKNQFNYLIVNNFSELLLSKINAFDIFDTVDFSDF